MSINRALIAKFIKQQRESLGWSQRELGRRLGCPQATVQLWESCKTTPDTENLAKIAALLGLQLSELFSLIEKDSVLSETPNTLGLKKMLQELDALPNSDVLLLVNAGVQKLAKAS